MREDLTLTNQRRYSSVFTELKILSLFAKDLCSILCAWTLKIRVGSLKIAILRYNMHHIKFSFKCKIQFGGGVFL